VVVGANASATKFVAACATLMGASGQFDANLCREKYSSD
jgi:hypothetical protein